MTDPYRLMDQRHRMFETEGTFYHRNRRELVYMSLRLPDECFHIQPSIYDELYPYYDYPRIYAIKRKYLTRLRHELWKLRRRGLTGFEFKPRVERAWTKAYINSHLMTNGREPLFKDV